MKFYFQILLLIVYTTSYTFGQAKSTAKDSIISIENRIDNKLSKSLETFYNLEYNEAINKVLDCISTSDSIKNDSLLGKGYITLGIMNSRLDKQNQAIVNLKKAEAIFSKTKNYRLLGVSFINIGVAYTLKNREIDTARITIQKEKDSIKSYFKRNTDSIKKYYNKALENYLLGKNYADAADVYYNLSITHFHAKDYKKTELKLRDALKLAEAHKKSSLENSLITHIYSSYAMLYKKKKNLKKALKYINLSEKLALKYKHNHILNTIYLSKSEILEDLNNVPESYYYLKKYNELLDKIHEAEKSTLPLEETAKFEAKEQKILLEKEILAQNIKEDKIKRSKQLIYLITTLIAIAILVAFLLSKNNLLKVENNKLLLVKNKKLKELQLNTELNFLKTQIQPHFFFNTLNNLYALIIEKSDKSKDVVVKLAELMKYTMYGTKKLTVPLLDEINNIKNYLELESLRYGKKATPTIQLDGDMTGINVPPLLFITFVENSFKHNDVSDNDFNLSISFNTKNSKHLFFKIQNTLITSIEKQNKKGIGIENVKRRLMLIYKENYDLKITSENNQHSVYLKIPLSFKKL